MLGAIANVIGQGATAMLNSNLAHEHAQAQQANSIALQNYANAQNAAIANTQRLYDSPLEQRRRMERAGLNPFTAMQNLASDTGISSASAQSAFAQQPYTPVNIDFSSISQALLAMQEMKFTKGENKLNRAMTERQLWATLANASELQRQQISAQKEMQMEQMQHQRRVQMVDEVIKQDFQNREHEHQRAMKEFDVYLDENRSPTLNTPYFKGTLEQFRNFIQNNVLGVLRDMMSGNKYEKDKKKTKEIVNSLPGIIETLLKLVK